MKSKAAEMRERHSNRRGFRAGIRILEGLIVLVCVLTIKGKTLAAVDRRVNFGEAKTFTLEQAPQQKILAIGGYFKAPDRFFRYRRCIVTVNGHRLGATRLRSPATFYQPRHPGCFEHPRIDEKTGGIKFPFTHRSGGLEDFVWSDAHEYDKWVHLYNNFPQVVYFDVSGLLTPGDETVEVRIYNNLDGTATVEGELVDPPFVITELALLGERPATDDFGPYVVPIWKFLDERSWARKLAADKLRSKTTPQAVKAQIFAQFGMLNLMTGQQQAAIRYFKAATALAVDFPEYEEICYRLMRMTGESTSAARTEDDTLSGRWARLHNNTLRVLKGEPVDSLINVPFSEAAFVPDGKADEAIWRDPATEWHSLPWQVTGPPDDGASRVSNRFAICYDETSLKLLFRGPGAPGLQQRDVPGEDRPAWEFNCVELFLCPNGAFTRYYELNVTAANGRYDSRLLWNGVPDPAADFEATWETGASISDDGMVVEYLVPWSDFGLSGPPEAGDLWIGNVIRVQHTPDAEGGLVHREFSAGNLLRRNFHRLQDGVFLRFKAVP